MTISQSDKDFLDSCLERRTRLRAEASRVSENKKQILEQEERLMRALMGLDMFIADLEARTGTKPQDAPPPSPAREKESQKETATAKPSTDPNTEDFSPTWFVRQFILDHANNGGASPAAIKKAGEGLRHVSANFPYGTLNRLKARGEILRRRGHYYPTDRMPKERTGDDIE